MTLDEVLPRLLGSQAPSRRAFPPRPQTFHLSPLGRFSVMEGCRHHHLAHQVRFRDSGRWFYAWAVFGANPSPKTITRVQRILDSLGIAPLRG